MIKTKESFVEDVKSVGEWHRIAERRVSLFIQDLIFKGEKSKKFNLVLEKDMPPIGDSFIKGFIHAPKISGERTILAIEELVVEKGFFALEDVSRRCQIIAKDLLNYLEKDISPTKQFLLKFQDLYTDLTSYLLLIVFSERFLESKAKELLFEKIGSDTDDYFEAISFTRKYNKTTHELIDLLNICIKIKNDNLSLADKIVELLIKEHVHKYSWLGTRWFFEEPWTANDFIARIKLYLEKDVETELKNILEPREQAERKTKEFIENYSLSEKEIDLINIIKEFVFLRTFRTENLSHAHALLKPLLENIAKKEQYSLDELMHLTIDELIRLIDKKEDFHDIANERINGYFIILCNDNIEIFVGDEKKLIEELNIFKDQEVMKSDIIKGKIAWKGKVSGKVKIVCGQSDLSKVEQGDILVTIMTFPNFIPVMEKASAFVTDEGGILCHAAIIAREMKKPCIIGTKFATKIFKDGDLVEVDANNGVVRKL